MKFDFQVVGTRGYLNGGPDKSRLNELKQFPRLFKGFNVFVEGHFGKPYPSSQDVAKVFQFSFVIQTETFLIKKKWGSGDRKIFVKKYKIDQEIKKALGGLG